jgi:NSS family neurotransmitter:Na+ symporter
MSRPETSIHGQWSSRWVFILAASGSAVGLGNVWKFPYITGENGGGAFVLVYLACIAAIGIPAMMAEVMLGRRGRQSPINTMQTLAQEAGAHPAWKLLGWSGVIAGLLILSYYSVIAGEAMAYVFRTFAGVFEGVTPDGAQHIYHALSNDPERLTLWHTAFMLITMVVVAQGVENGLERSVKILMPALIVILFMLVVYAMSTGDYFRQGLSFLFNPDFSKLTGQAILTAMGHAFFYIKFGYGSHHDLWFISP